MRIKKLNFPFLLLFSVCLICSCGSDDDNAEELTNSGEYQLVWADEFDGNSLDESNWNYETNDAGGGNQEKQYYTKRPQNINVSGGCLIIKALKESYGGREYTSARINTKGKRSFAYGKIEARISLPSGKGTWPAFWMLGANNSTAGWPLCGEIDIMEHVGSAPTMISHALHTSVANGNNGKNWNKKQYFGNMEGEFHVYAIEWIKEADLGDDVIRFYVDNQLSGELYGSYNRSGVSGWPFYKDFFIILNLALGGNMGGTIDNAIFNNPVEMKVDYVRVYQKR